MAHGRPPEDTRFPARDLARAALDSDLVTGHIFFVNVVNVVNGENPLLTRESTAGLRCARIHENAANKWRHHEPDVQSR